MIVARDIDLENIEKSKQFDGLYMVLGGTIPVLEKEPARRIRQDELLKRIDTLSVGGLSEIIIASDYNPEGEHTREYIDELITPLAREKNIKISHLGRGLSMGSELEYIDNETIKNALKNRI
jgi:recombination protein RecR